jgi:hypothetical protein
VVHSKRKFSPLSTEHAMHDAICRDLHGWKFIGIPPNDVAYLNRTSSRDRWFPRPTLKESMVETWMLRLPSLGPCYPRFLP